MNESKTLLVWVCGGRGSQTNHGTTPVPTLYLLDNTVLRPFISVTQVRYFFKLWFLLNCHISRPVLCIALFSGDY